MKKTILTLILGFITSLTFAQQQLPVVDTSFQAISCNTFPHYCIGQAYGLTFVPAPSSSSKK
jgi:hypothetical protein